MLVSWSYPPNQSYSDGRHRKHQFIPLITDTHMGRTVSNVWSNNDNTSPTPILGVFLSDYPENYGPAIHSGLHACVIRQQRGKIQCSRSYLYCGSPPISFGNGSRKAYVETPHTSYAYRKNHALLRSNLGRIRYTTIVLSAIPISSSASQSSRYYRRSWPRNADSRAPTSGKRRYGRQIDASPSS